jgi:hypothetical protein
VANLADIREQEQELTGLLRDIRRLTRGGGPGDIAAIRAADRKRKSEERKAAAALFIPRPEDDERRRRLEGDVFEWLRWYFPDIFTEDFQTHQREMAQAILNACRFAGDQAIAAPRGEGKTTISECVVIYAIICGLVNFAVLFAATAADAGNSLKSMKEYIRDSDRLAADYPSLCVPIREVDSAPQRAHSIVVYGDDFPLTEAHFEWSGDEIAMPKVPDLVCAAARIATRGLDSAVRGLKKGKKRPQVAIIDDPDTEDTARSEDQGKKLSARIERAIAGLAPKGKKMSRVLLTTLQNRTCVSAQFTDPKVKPSWKGKRFGFVKTKPTRMDLWDEYIALRHRCLSEGDEFGRKAHAFYLEQREVMDAGAEVTNQFSFDGRLLPDGSQLQVSALQKYFDFVADNGEEAALCELQNDPPEESLAQESGITPHRVQRQVSGWAQAVVPPGCTCITQGEDVHKRALYWVVRAWRPDPDGYATGFTIDYGVTEVLGTKPNVDEGVDEAVYQALHARKEWMEQNPYVTADGQIVDQQLTLIDSMWKRDAVFRFCDEAGLGWYPGIGYGKSSGCASPNFREPVASNPHKIMGWQNFSSPRADGGWIIHINADHWKGWEHDRWMSDPDKAGALLLFGEPSADPERFSADQKGHHSYAQHICAEIEVEKPIKGVLKRYWKTKSHNNHYLDCSYRADVAAAMCGMRMFGMPVVQQYEEAEATPVVSLPDGTPFCVLDRG